jgi:hypothetical protein
MNRVEFSHICSNCGHQVTEGDKFCNQCGQKQPLNNLSFRAMISDMWQVMTNMDNSFFRTLRDIWRPWTITQRYIIGHRKKYVNPFRFFFILLLIYVGLLVSQSNLKPGSKGKIKFDIVGVPLNTDFIYDYNNIKKLDSLNNDIKKLKTQYPENSPIFADIDSLFNKNSLNLPKDTLIDITLNNKLYKFHIDDIVNMEMDSVYMKYNVSSFIDKVFVKQAIKATKDPIGVTKVIFGNLTWMIVLTLLLLALFFKLLYFKQRRPFVEHVILLANIHSLSFLVNIILLTLTPYSYIFYSVILVVPIIIFIISIKLYYKNSIFITLLKSFASSLIYFTFFIFSLVIVTLISFFIF